MPFLRRLSPSCTPVARLMLAAILATVLTACSKTPDMPRGWGPLRFAADSGCPWVYGTYDATDPDFGYVMAGQFLPYDTTRGPIESMSLVIEDDTLLTVIAWVDREPRDTVRLKSGREFVCKDGWLEPHYPSWLPRYAVDTGAARAQYVGRHVMRVAVGDKGALIGRHDHHTYDEFAVWCGDGCRGFPIPWTWRTAHHWTRAEVVNPAVKRIVRAPARPLSPIDERILRESDLLENGPPPSAEQRRIAALVRSVLPLGGELQAVSPSGDGWNLSLLYNSATEDEPFLSALLRAGEWEEMRVDPLSSLNTTDGRVTRVVYVKVAR